VSGGLKGLRMLPEDKISFFREHGYLLVEQVVGPQLLRRLRTDFDAWVEESRNHTAPYGQTLDGRPRFDLETGHSALRPALRRVASPIEVSEAYLEAVLAPDLVKAVADLIGPNVKFHHCKINSKLPGTATAVKWHQDFPFTPHSNDDLVTALLMLDDVTHENGPLEVWPGTHRGALHDLWRGDHFTGAVDEAFARTCQANAVRCIGPAGSACLMHTRLLHGSAPNLSAGPRTLFIAVYSAEDARPLGDNPLPSRYEGMVVHGKATGRVRSTPFDIRLPQKPQGASFFAQQALTSEPVGP
jgi:ectoine hydroxylase-related dioxygenase (phytanoyl-CoA dioxygenase family)